MTVEEHIARGRKIREERAFAQHAINADLQEVVQDHPVIQRLEQRLTFVNLALALMAAWMVAHVVFFH